MAMIDEAFAAPRWRHRSWRIWRIMPLNEAAFRARLWLAPLMLGIQIYLYYCLWTAVYHNTASTAGLDVRQTVTYATLGLLVARIRWSARVWSKEHVAAAVREGTIIYWFLRPIPPSRYYMLRGIGDAGYGALWASLGFAASAVAGIIEPPRSAGAGVVFAVSLVLGQIILYYLGALVDLATFWLISGSGLARMYYFVQDLLSGVFVPLWFLPPVLLTLSALLPFYYAVNVPLSLYVGRIPLDQAAGLLAIQSGWIILLALLARYVWSRASRRVSAQGG